MDITLRLLQVFSGSHQRILLLVGALLTGLLSENAAVCAVKSGNDHKVSERNSRQQTPGLWIGGRAGKEAALETVEWRQNAGVETLTLGFRELNTKTSLFQPPFYQVLLEAGRLTINIDEVTVVDQDPSRLDWRQSRCLNSPNVALDPLQPTTHLIFSIKTHCQLRVSTKNNLLQVELR